MTDLLARRKPRWLAELSEVFTEFPTWADLPLIVDTQPMRLEDEMEDGHYVVRAEIPGIDPAKDVDITVRDGRMTIKAERTEKKEAKGRSEFRYGSFVRSVMLPTGGQRRRHQSHIRQRHPDRLGRRSRTGCAGREARCRAGGELIR